MRFPTQSGKVVCKLLCGVLASCKPPFRMSEMHSHFQTPSALRNDSDVVAQSFMNHPSEVRRACDSLIRRLDDSLSACRRRGALFSCRLMPRRANPVVYGETSFGNVNANTKLWSSPNRHEMYSGLVTGDHSPNEPVWKWIRRSC